MVVVEPYSKGQRGVAINQGKICSLRRQVHFRIGITSLVLACVILSGCSQFRVPKIDPNGKGLFVSGDSTEITRPFNDTEKVRDLPTLFPKPAFRIPEPGEDATGRSPSRPQSSTDQNTDTADQITPGMIWVSPKVMAAPVGNAVVLKAGIVGSKKQLLPGRKLEWTIAEGSQGLIESAGGGNPNTFRMLFPKYGNQASETYAHTTTADRAEVVHQDTTEVFDDIGVAKGEGWVVVSSDVKGTTELLIGASTETNWDKQYQKILVHWIDAQWQFPTSVSANAGSDQVLTTSVSRPSDNTPLSGWTIRYKLVSNRNATLSSAANNEQLDTIDVTTDADGQATIRVSPNANQAGVVYVTTEVIRPADVSLATPALVVGESTIAVTWNSPGLQVTSSSPKIVELGKTMECQVTIANPGNQTATNVTVSQSIPAGLAIDTSNPVANITGNQATWNIGDLAPQTQKQLTIRYTTGQAGDTNPSFLVTCDEGLQNEASSLTKVMTTPLEITIEGPRIAKLGDDIQFQILLHNASTEPISGLQLLETLGPGLIHISKSNPLGNPTVRKLAFQSRTIEPNSTTVKAISMRATRAGTLCHTLQATLANGLVLKKEVCIEVSAPIQPESNSPPVVQASILTPDNQPDWEAGETSTRRFQITNQSKEPITNVTIKATLPAELQPQLASEGHRSEGQSVLLDIPTLLPGQSRTLVVQILATDVITDTLVQMEVTGDAIQKITKSNPVTIQATTKTNPLDLSPPPEAEPPAELPDSDPLPNLDPPDSQDAFPVEDPENADSPSNPDPQTSEAEPPTDAAEPQVAAPEEDAFPLSDSETPDPTTPEPDPADSKPAEGEPELPELNLPVSPDSTDAGETIEDGDPDPPTQEEKPAQPTEDPPDNTPPPALDSNQPADTTAPDQSNDNNQPMDNADRPVLSAKILSLNNPITVGDENTFFVYLRNDGPTPASQIELKVAAGEHYKILSVAQKETAASVFENSVDAQQQLATIPVIAQLSTGKSILPYQIKVISIKEGMGTLTVIVKADGFKKPIETVGEIRILPAK